MNPLSGCCSCYPFATRTLRLCDGLNRTLDATDANATFGFVPSFFFVLSIWCFDLVLCLLRGDRCTSFLRLEYCNPLFIMVSLKFFIVHQCLGFVSGQPPMLRKADWYAWSWYDVKWVKAPANKARCRWNYCIFLLLPLISKQDKARLVYVLVRAGTSSNVQDCA